MKMPLNKKPVTITSTSKSNFGCFTKKFYMTALFTYSSSNPNYLIIFCSKLTFPTDIFQTEKYMLKLNSDEDL